MREKLSKNINYIKNVMNASDRTGWIVDDVAFFLYSMIKFYKPDLVIQIGHLWGKSSVVVCEAMSDGFLHDNFIERGKLSGDEKFFDFVTKNKPEKKEKINFISIDAYPYGNWEQAIKFLENEYNFFEFINSKSEDFFSNKQKIEQLKNEYKTIFGIVDGDHSYDGCYSDIQNLINMNTTVIFVDDTKWIPHIEKACRDAAEKNNYKFINHGIYNGIGVLIR